MLSDRERRFLSACRVGHLATANARAHPHVVPVCFAIADDTLYITIDEKPKQSGGAALKRVRNLQENPTVAFVADRYDDDWAKLGWVMLRGRGEILTGGAEHDRAQALLRARYRPLSAMRIEGLAVIAVRLERATSWGDLSVGSDEPGRSTRD
jgi:PPOX class probable F420-dependent enzyme